MSGAHEKNGPLDPGDPAKRPKCFNDLHTDSSHAKYIHECVAIVHSPQNRQIPETAGRDREVHVQET